MADGWTDSDDRLLARSVFGTDDDGIVERMIGDWVQRQGLGEAAAMAIEFSVGAAVTIDLADRTRIFVKVWPGSTDVRALGAQLDVQREMGVRGFPAPTVLTPLAPLGPASAIGMTYNRAGVPTDARVPGVRKMMAAGLARFVLEADAFRSHDGLPRRDLPAEAKIWPRPHSALFDFEATAENAAWIDDAARPALAVLRAATSRVVVGHCDWSAKNMRMDASGIAVVYDWDSVFLERETIMLGTAAAHFPVTWELDVPETPSRDAAAAFLRDYEVARGSAFTRSEIAEIDAGLTYARAYKARCEHAIDTEGVRWHGSSREDLRIHGPFRLQR